MDQLAQHIESIVFVSESPISFKEIKVCLEEAFETKFKKPALEKAIDLLKEKYQEEQFSFEFLEIAGGFQFLTKPAFHNSVGTLLRQNNKRRLSKAALETLSIIAYKQPVPKSEMEKIRGVSCDYSVQKLLEKELVAIVGRSEAPGRPLLYGTSEKFMDYFGLKSLEDMPKPKDFTEPDNEIGEQAPIDESAKATSIQETSIEDAQPSANEEVPTASTEAIESTAETMSTEVITETLGNEESQSIEEEITLNEEITKEETTSTELSEDNADYEDFITDVEDTPEIDTPSADDSEE